MQKRAKWVFDDLVTADGHRLSVTFSAALRAVPDAAEKQLFVESFGESASDDTVVGHFSTPLTAAAAELAGRQAVEAALSEDFRGRWIETLRATGNAIAFGCGVELLPPLTIEVGSPTLRRERLEQMQRTASQRQTADRVETFQRTAELLKQWESLRSSSPTITPGKMLENLNPADRGGMLEMLLMASAGEKGPGKVWAVAGAELLGIDIATQQTRSTPLPVTAGPLRSVQVQDGKVLVGARNGVLIVDSANADRLEVYLDPDLVSEYGFSDVAFCFDGVWAGHRDGGVVGWRNGQMDRPERSIRSSELGGGAKFLMPSHDRLLMAVGQRLVGLSGSGAVTPLVELASPIVAVLQLDERIILAAEDGTVAIHDGRTLERISDSRPVGRLSGAALLPWLSSARLLLTTPDGPIFSVGLDDQLVMQYVGLQLGVRAVASSAATVAAMTVDRQRIVFWNAWDGRRPAGEIHVANVAKHRIADIAFG
jgi:hypothetical protein